MQLDSSTILYTNYYWESIHKKGAAPIKEVP